MFQYVPTDYAHIFFIVCLVALAVIALVCLVRAILGPRYTDRIMAANMIGTITLLMVCILAIVLGESYIVDIALIYALLSFVAVVVLTKLVITRYRVKKMEQHKAETKETKEINEQSQKEEEPNHD